MLLDYFILFCCTLLEGRNRKLGVYFPFIDFWFGWWVHDWSSWWVAWWTVPAVGVVDTGYFIGWFLGVVFGMFWFLFIFIVVGLMLAFNCDTV